MPETDVGVGLADAVNTVRLELEKAINAGKDSAIAFEAGPVEMEFDVTFTASAGANASVQAWVVSIGGKGEVAGSSANRLKIVLQPVDRSTRKNALIGDIDTD